MTNRFKISILLCVLLPLFHAQNQCYNFDFEMSSPTEISISSVPGWTVSNNKVVGICNPASSSWTVGSNHFYLVSTPVVNVPVLGVIGHSPLGGTVVAQIGDFSGVSKANRLSRTFTVTPSNTVLTYAYASAMYYSTSYGCCDGPAFRVLIRDCAGNLLNCLSNTLNPVCNTTPNFTNLVATGAGTMYTNWQVKQIDLSAHLNSCITLEVISNDCAFGGHPTVGYFDAICGGDLIPPTGVSYCQNGNSAILQAPPGYSAYAWYSSTGSLSANPSQSSYTVSSPSPNQTFTAQLTTFAGCTSTLGFVLSTTQVSITALGAKPSCPFGANGTASVIAAGSGSGYNYTWTNATNSVVGTGSIVQNLAPGVYSVHVAAQNNSLCGVAGSTVLVANNQSERYYAPKPYCGTTAYLSASGGSNFQWYINGTAVPGIAGTAASLAITSPTNGDVVKLEYVSAQGCHDTIIYTLWPSQATPSVSALFNGTICEGASNAQATINLVPSGGGFNNGTNYFNIVSTGLTAGYSVSSGAQTQTTFTVSGLQGGGTYSVISFDGSCFASNAFSVPTFSTGSLFDVYPNDTVFLCSGTSVNAFVYIFSLPPSHFTYSWLPTNFMSGAGNFPNALITPTVGLGSSSTLIYSVVVTPTFINCPATKTIQIIVSNPHIPVISPTGPLCNNDPSLTVSASPAGGLFSGGSYIDSLGNIAPHLASPGINTFSYTTVTNACSVTATSAFTLLQAPLVSVTGSDSLCFGTSGTLTAHGATTYQWNDGSSNLQLPINPATNTFYTVTGTATNGCSASHTVPVFVFPFPTVAVSGNTPVCEGELLVLQSTGAQHIQWISGPASASYSLYPTTAGVYSVIGSDPPFLCPDTAAVTITVHPKPEITVNAPDTVCRGEMVFLTATGAENLTWNNQSPGNIFTNVIYVTNTYTIAGTNSYGCTSTVYHTVNTRLCSGIGEYSTINTLRVYPNPASDHVSLMLGEAALVKILDGQGRTVYEGFYEPGVRQITINNLSEGVYQINSLTRSGITSARLIKLTRH